MRVGVVVPAHNAEAYVGRALDSVLACDPLDAGDSFEVSVAVDACSDDTLGVVEAFAARARARGVQCSITETAERCPGGARNAAEAALSRKVDALMLLDADDECLPGRLRRGVAALKEHCGEDDDALVGSAVVRSPPNAQARYTAWANRPLAGAELEAHAFREVCILQPTWFMPRRLWHRCGGQTTALCEDLQMQYDAMALGAKLVRITDEPLVVYTHTEGSISSVVSRKELLRVRIAAIVRLVLSRPGWEKVTIWSRGRDGKQLFRGLPAEARRQVVAFCDVAPRDALYDAENKRHVPCVAWQDAKPPFLLAVALNRPNDKGPTFENNLASLKLEPMRDYVHCF